MIGINSKNPKIAWFAFRWKERSEEEILALLRREDVVIRDQIFDFALHARLGHTVMYPNLIGMIRQDPSHPYYSRVRQMDDKAEAERAEQQEQKRQCALAYIVKMDTDGETGDILDRKIQYFSKTYDPTDEEKTLLAEILFRWAKRRATRETEIDRLLNAGIGPLLTEPFILRHVTELPRDLCSAGKKKIEAAVSRAGFTDDRKREICLRYRIYDPKVVTKCEIGMHEDVFVDTETEENYEDWTRPITYNVYRCKLCGRERREKAE